MAEKAERAGVEDAHNRMSPTRSTGSLPLHLRALDLGLILGWPVRQ